MIIPACGRKTGIRTLGTLRYTRFPGVPVKPLPHLSFFKKRNLWVIVVTYKENNMGAIPAAKIFQSPN